jgi:ATP-dependent protease HslVU (ClpYQ) peptidase subunit
MANLIRLHQHQVARETVPNTQMPTLGVLVAGHTNGEGWILEIAANGEDTYYEGYYAVGSGGTFANQAMTSVAHYDVLNLDPPFEFVMPA